MKPLGREWFLYLEERQTQFSYIVVVFNIEAFFFAQISGICTCQIQFFDNLGCQLSG